MVKEVFNGKAQKIQPRVQARGCTTNPTGRGICSTGSPGPWNQSQYAQSMATGA